MKKARIVLTMIAIGWLAASSAHATTVAYWRFETDSDVPVSNGQTVTQADDASGNG